MELVGVDRRAHGGRHRRPDSGHGCGVGAPPRGRPPLSARSVKVWVTVRRSEAISSSALAFLPILVVQHPCSVGCPFCLGGGCSSASAEVTSDESHTCDQHTRDQAVALSISPGGLDTRLSLGLRDPERRQSANVYPRLPCNTRRTLWFSIVPFAFEVGEVLGDESEDFLREVAKVAEHCRRGVGDLTHWSAMIWGGHWRQRIGVEIARGLARCIERAATGGRVEGSSARSRSQEWDPSCC